jgi:hypothetical protein
MDSKRAALNIILILVALLATAFAIQSIYLFFNFNSSLPAGDIWRFLFDYYRYLDGNYHFLDLFAKHNEHIIFTTRLLLFIDGLFFHMAGLFPVIVTYVALLSIAVVIAAMAAGTGLRRRDWGIATMAFLGLTWSIAQQENLSYEFQVGWALVHLFALTCILSGAMALAATERSARRAWYALALASDFLAVFSLASGLLIIVPLLAIPLWLRRIDRGYAALIVFHLCLMVAHVLRHEDLRIDIGASPVTLQEMGASPVTLQEMALYLLLYLGNSLGGLPALRVPVGGLVLVFLVGLAGWGTWEALLRKRPLELNTTVLLGMGLLILCEAAVTDYGRSFFGVDQAASSRYGTASLIALACCFALGWRLCRSDLMRIPLAALLGIAIWASNAYQPYVYGWLYRADALDDIAFALINGTYPADKMEAYSVILFPKQSVKKVRRAMILGLGPFSAWASRYQPPSTQLPALDAKGLPACLANIEKVSAAGLGMLEIQGWAILPSKAGDGWILAYDDAGKLIGLARASHPRPDVIAVFPHAGSDRVGFDLFLASVRVPEDGALLAVAGSSGAETACTIPGRLTGN